MARYGTITITSKHPQTWVHQPVDFLKTANGRTHHYLFTDCPVVHHKPTHTVRADHTTLNPNHICKTCIKTRSLNEYKVLAQYGGLGFRIVDTLHRADSITQQHPDTIGTTTYRIVTNTLRDLNQLANDITNTGRDHTHLARHLRKLHQHIIDHITTTTTSPHTNTAAYGELADTATITAALPNLYINTAKNCANIEHHIRNTLRDNGGGTLTDALAAALATKADGNPSTRAHTSSRTYITRVISEAPVALYADLIDTDSTTTLAEQLAPHATTINQRISQHSAQHILHTLSDFVNDLLDSTNVIAAVDTDRHQTIDALHSIFHPHNPAGVRMTTIEQHGRRHLIVGPRKLIETALNQRLGDNLHPDEHITYINLDGIDTHTLCETLEALAGTDGHNNWVTTAHTLTPAA